MSESEKQSGGDEERSAPKPKQPAREPERRAPENEGIDLSIEERGMLVAPEVPVPTNKVDTGNMPAAEAHPASGGGDQDGGDGERQSGGEGAGE